MPGAVAGACKPSRWAVTLSECTGSGFACWQPKLWLKQPQLGPPEYWLLERAQTWVDTEGGQIRTSVIGRQSQEQRKSKGRWFE